ncbi:MAG TPA: tRNA (cytidine(34)-2'-O)-methyltransferase [Thermoanaerobaculia bacterium]|nr:tRNA (cytidine(34)-2'-O)-methyltransferase [Thermoanaerobaculia bacterium]
MTKAPRASPPIHVVLVEPEIHWNTGNIGRTCLGAGAQLHLVRPLGFQLTEARLRRAGLDYWPRVEPRIWQDWATFEEALPGLGQARFFSAEARMDYWDASYDEEIALIFGAESSGLPTAVRRSYASRLYAVPMVDPQVRSLNLSTTVALVLYEAMRQRRTSNQA